MQVFVAPNKQTWDDLLKRPSVDAALLLPKVQAILDEVAKEGDKALKKYSLEFDQVTLDSIAIDPSMVQAAEQSLTSGLKSAIQSAKVNIEIFHQAQLKKEEKILEEKYGEVYRQYKKKVKNWI